MKSVMYAKVGKQLNTFLLHIDSNRVVQGFCSFSAGVPLYVI
jgi:hypothetical protein